MRRGLRLDAVDLHRPLDLLQVELHAEALLGEGHIYGVMAIAFARGAVSRLATARRAIASLKPPARGRGGYALGVSQRLISDPVCPTRNR